MQKEDALTDERTCPKCSSQDSGCTQRFIGTKKVDLRKCNACGTFWRPAESNIVGLAYVLLGGFCLIMFLQIRAATTDPHHANNILEWFEFGPIIIVCTFAVFRGVLLLIGVGGKKRIVTVKDAVPPPIPKPKTGPREKECPYCGKRYPGSADVCAYDMHELVDADKDGVR